MSAGEAVRWALNFSHLCVEGVARGGEFQPCEKTAVALRIDPEDGLPYAVCAHHSRGVMVPLADVISAAAVPGESTKPEKTAGRGD